MRRSQLAANSPGVRSPCRSARRTSSMSELTPSLRPSATGPAPSPNRSMRQSVWLSPTAAHGFSGRPPSHSFPACRDPGRSAPVEMFQRALPPVVHRLLGALRGLPTPTLVPARGQLGVLCARKHIRPHCLAIAVVSRHLAAVAIPLRRPTAAPEQQPRRRGELLETVNY